MAHRVDPMASLTLVDFSPGMIEAAERELGSRADYVVAEAEALPFTDGSFDAVIASHMLYHAEQLRPFFMAIRVERFDDGLAVTDSEPLPAYIRPSEGLCGQRSDRRSGDRRRGDRLGRVVPRGKATRCDQRRKA